MLIMLCAVMAPEISLNEVKISGKIFYITSIIIAIWILFFKRFPNIYWKTFYKLLSEPSRELASYYIPRGYGVPIGGTYPLAYYIMIVGLLYLYSITFNKTLKMSTKIKNIIYMLIILASMVAEGRRGELLAAIAALLFLSFLSRNIIHIYKMVLVCILFGGIIFLNRQYILTTLKSITFFRRYITTIEGLLSGADITSGRTELWKLAIELFKEVPLFGIGFGGFAYHISDKFRAIHGQDVMNVHNCTLQLLCENGIVGTIFIVIPMIIIFIKSCAILKKIQRYSLQNPYYYWADIAGKIAVGIQIFFACVCQLDPAFYKPVFWGFYGFSIVLICGMKKLYDCGVNFNTDILKEDL